MNAKPEILGYGVEVGGTVYRFDDERAATLYATKYGLTVLVLVPARQYAAIFGPAPNLRTLSGGSASEATTTTAQKEQGGKP